MSTKMGEGLKRGQIIFKQPFQITRFSKEKRRIEIELKRLKKKSLKSF